MRTCDIYNEMHSRKLTTSKRSWSKDWLGRAHNFATTHWSQPLPPETMLHLRSRLLAGGYPDLAAKLLLVLLNEAPSGDCAGTRSRDGAA